MKMKSMIGIKITYVRIGYLKEFDAILKDIKVLFTCHSQEVRPNYINCRMYYSKLNVKNV